MNLESPRSIIEQLSDIHEDASAYFAKVIEEFSSDDEEAKYSWMRPPTEEYWNKLPPPLVDEANAIASNLAALAKITGPAIRRSPLLTEADAHEAGYAFKGLRSALRLREFQHEDVEVLHDEGSVLGVRPASDSEVAVKPRGARFIFDRLMDGLKQRLELADPNSALAPDVTLSPAKPTAAGIRAGTAFIMMWIAEDRPELVDVGDTVKECFAKFGITALRADDIEHEDVITNRIIDEIKTAEFLFADLTGERHSVYYEVGYAHALARRVILMRKKGTKIHFDLAAYNCPEYTNMADRRKKMMARLESVTGKKPS